MALTRRSALSLGSIAVLVATGAVAFAILGTGDDRGTTAASKPEPQASGSTETTEGLSDEVVAQLEDVEVVVGRNGWLFFGEDVTVDCEALARAGGLDRLGRGPELVRYVIDQPASAFYPDQIEPADAPDACVEQVRTAQRARFAADPLAVDVDAALRAERDRGVEVFYRTDTHWTPPARITVAEQLVDALLPGLWDPAAVKEGELPRTNDLGQVVGVDAPTTVTGPTVERGPVEVLERQVVELFGPDFVNRGRTRSGAEPTIPGVTYIVGDSQFAYLLPDIEPYFDELIFLNWFLIELGATEFPDLPDPDRLVVQSIDRYAAERFEHPVLDGLAARLPS